MPQIEYTKEYFDGQIDKLVDTMKKYDPKVDGGVVHAAFDFAISEHGVQERESGEPYIVHPLKVAEILASMEMDQTTIVAALLRLSQWVDFALGTAGLVAVAVSTVRLRL